MRLTMRFLLVLLLGAFVLAAPGELRRFKLSNGKRLAGRVIESECSDEVLVLRDLRTKKKVTLPWSELDEAQAHDLRVELGFEVAEAAADARLMTAHKIVNKVGITFVGKWMNPKTYKRDGMYVLKTSEGPRKISLRDVREGPTEVKVDAKEIFTSAELYDQKRSEMEPIDTAEKHYLLAEYSRTVDALDHALEHYKKCMEFEDSKYSPEKLQRLIDKVERLLASTEAREELKDIKQSTWHKNFKKAAEMIAAFRTKHEGDAALLEQVDRLEEDLQERRADHYTTIVPRMLRDTIKSLLKDKVKEQDLTLRQAMQYAGGEPSAEESVSRAAIDKIAEKLGIEPKEVLTFWNGRMRSVQRAFYRDGTFIVVENLPDALAKAPRFKPKKDGPKPPKPTKQRTPEEWWQGKIQTRKYSDLADWLYAYWAEKSTMTDPMEPKDSTCPVCAGKGYTQTMITTPQGTIPFADRCQNCHMATFWRIVRFK